MTGYTHNYSFELLSDYAIDDIWQYFRLFEWYLYDRMEYIRLIEDNNFMILIIIFTAE